MARWGWRIIGVVLTFLVMSACGGEDNAARIGPPDIEYGVDISEMGMAVVDPRYTAAALPNEGDEWILFDDIGELLQYIQTNANADFEVVWVHDFNDETWLKAGDAWYLESREFTTSPMGWGIATFKDEDSARAAQEEFGGELYTWDEVMKQTWDRPPGPDE